MSESLKPCPFCGGESYRKTVECGGFDSLESGTIRCSHCGAQGPTKTTSWSEIERGWNQRHEENDVCEWQFNETGYWSTKCGGSWEFYTDGPVENKARFCPYCSKKIKIV